MRFHGTPWNTADDVRILLKNTRFSTPLVVILLKVTCLQQMRRGQVPFNPVDLPYLSVCFPSKARRFADPVMKSEAGNTTSSVSRAVYYNVHAGPPAADKQHVGMRHVRVLVTTQVSCVGYPVWGDT